MSSSPIGGDAVKNSIVSSNFLLFSAFYYFRRERQSLLRSCPWRKRSEALGMRGSLGMTYRDHLADPVANHQRREHRDESRSVFLLSPVLLRRGGLFLGVIKIVAGDSRLPRTAD